MSKFDVGVYFGTPVWTNQVPEFIQPMNKLADKYLKTAKKNLLPTLKERDKIYKRKLGDFGLSKHVTGFYFLKASERTSMPTLHDPRQGAVMTKLPEKDQNKITYANESVHYKVQPGTMVIIPGYTPHQYPVDMGIEPFRFVHWNIQCVPKTISNAVNTP